MTSTLIPQIQSFSNFAQKSKVMKRLFFRSEKAFLEKLDGKAYAICNKHGHYLCDIIEDDYLRLIDAGIIINLDDNRNYTLMEADCNDMLTLAENYICVDDFKASNVFITMDGIVAYDFDLYNKKTSKTRSLQ